MSFLVDNVGLNRILRNHNSVITTTTSRCKNNNKYCAQQSE